MGWLGCGDTLGRGASRAADSSPAQDFTARDALATRCRTSNARGRRFALVPTRGEAVTFPHIPSVASNRPALHLDNAPASGAWSLRNRIGSAVFV